MMVVEFFGLGTVVPRCF